MAATDGMKNPACSRGKCCPRRWPRPPDRSGKSCRSIQPIERIEKRQDREQTTDKRQEGRKKRKERGKKRKEKREKSTRSGGDRGLPPMTRFLKAVPAAVLCRFSTEGSQINQNHGN